MLNDRQYFGNQVDSRLINDFRLKLKALFPHSTLFKSEEEQEADKLMVIQNLSITPAVSSTTSSGTNEITEKLAGANLKDTQTHETS